MASGLGLSGGMVQPMFLVGGVWGRFIGNFVHDYISAEVTPGLYALIGSAGFIGGLQRSTISFTVILIEVSGQLHLMLPIMFAMTVGKFIGDRISPLSFYHMLMHLKNYPFLERSAARITRLLIAKQVMSPNVKTLPEQPKVKEVIDLLMSCPHNGFPVLDESGTLVGLVSLVYPSYYVYFVDIKKTFAHTVA
jgi:chloride channel 7